MNTTNIVRYVLLGCTVAIILCILGAFMLGKDPSPLYTPLGLTLGGNGVGEASNAAKRWTTKPELVLREEQQ